MTTQTIQALIGIFTSILIPFVISKWTTLKWSSGQKEALLVGLSVVGGVLIAALDGKFVFSNWESIANTVLAIYAGARGTYQLILKGLGLEKIIDPKEALVSEGKQQIKADVQKMTIETAKAALDTSDPSTNILVQTSIV